MTKHPKAAEQPAGLLLEVGISQRLAVFASFTMKYAAVFSTDHCLFNEKPRCNAYSALLAGELQRGNT